MKSKLLRTLSLIVALPICAAASAAASVPNAFYRIAGAAGLSSIHRLSLATMRAIRAGDPNCVSHNCAISSQCFMADSHNCCYVQGENTWGEEEALPFNECLGLSCAGIRTQPCYLECYSDSACTVELGNCQFSSYCAC